MLEHLPGLRQLPGHRLAEGLQEDVKDDAGGGTRVAQQDLPQPVVSAQPHLRRHFCTGVQCLNSDLYLYLLARLKVNCADQPAASFLPALRPHHHLHLPRLAVILLQRLVHLHAA